MTNQMPQRPLRVLMTLTYYWPHISGLTLYAKRLAEGLAGRGVAVRLLTSRYDSSLAAYEQAGGVNVERSRVWWRLSKGVIMPGFILRCWRACHDADVVNLHLPQIEASLVAIYARLVARKPVFTTYHCDLELPPGLARTLFTPLIKLSHLVTVLFSTKVVCNSEDYVKASRFLRHFRGRIQVSYPPCARLEPHGAPMPLNLREGEKLIGFVGRFAEEKGVEYIIAAMPRVMESHPGAVLGFAGEPNAVGERVYQSMRPQIDALGERVRLLGVLAEPELAAFYRRCDVLLLPSINSTESFGMVQVEAMYSGVPVIASDIPGVRVPVSVTGMGKLVVPRDSAALADAIVEALINREASVRSQADLEALFGVERSLDFYESLFNTAIGVSPDDPAVASSP